MTAVSAQARRGPVRRPRVIPPVTFVRLLWIELRRGQLPLILPLIALLFWFDSYRPSTSQEPLYALVTFWNMGQGHTIIDFGPFVAGMAAWTGSRDGRRGTLDLVTATPRPRWTTQLATWAATAIWAVASYLVFVAAMFAVYAHRGVAGEPPWWWVAVGATAVAAFSAAGFTLGTLFRNRFIAPLAAFGGFFVMMMSSQTGFRDTSGWALILPTNSNGNLQQDSGIFYPYLPDLPIARIMFLAGIGVAMLGLAGLPAAASGSRRLRVVAAAVIAAGVASTATGVTLASTATLGPHGIVIPALHDAAEDRPIAYTPVCDGTAFLICVNPAYQRYLSDLTTALEPAVTEVAGLPGTPVRAVQVAATYNAEDGQGDQPMTITGNPPVLSIPLGAYNFLPGPAGFSNVSVTKTTFDQSLRAAFFQVFTGGGGTPAQQAVQAALLRGPGGDTGPVYSAARRFAALPAATRHAWLASHLAALRAGRLTLGQLP